MQITQTNQATPQDSHLLMTAKVLHTAFLTTQQDSAPSSPPTHLTEVMKAPAFQMLVQAVLQLAEEQKQTEQEAAEAVLGVFRKLDAIWSRYLIQQGLDKLKLRTCEERA